MSDINIVTLGGRVVAEPEPIGEDGVRFRMVTNRPVKDGDEWTEVPEWHSVVAWNNVAQTVKRFYHKGSYVTVVGQVRYRQHEDKYYTDIVVRECTLPPKPTGATTPAAPVATAKQPWEQ